jgi:hypothetical protein
MVAGRSKIQAGKETGMSTFQQVMIIVDGEGRGGYTYGKVRYPDQYKDQDANAILAMFGQQGFEVTQVKVVGIKVVIFLKRSV